MKEPKLIDCTGMNCPQPVIRTKEELEKEPSVAELQVLVDNEAARENVGRFARSQGCEVMVTQEGANFALHIKKGKAAAQAAAVIACPGGVTGATVVYLGADTMGRGDDGLGSNLMKVFIDTLSHFAQDISHLALVNSGVRLACHGSPVLAQLEGLDGMGIKILACGACLKHYGLTEKLAVGEVSNMYAILEVMTKAGKVIAP